MPRKAEDKVKCPRCPGMFAVSQLHRHVSSQHHGMNPDTPGIKVEKPKKPHAPKDIPGQRLLFPEESAQD